MNELDTNQLNSKIRQEIAGHLLAAEAQLEALALHVESQSPVLPPAVMSETARVHSEALRHIAKAIAATIESTK